MTIGAPGSPRLSRRVAECRQRLGRDDTLGAGLVGRAAGGPRDRRSRRRGWTSPSSRHPTTHSMTTPACQPEGLNVRPRPGHQHLAASTRVAGPPARARPSPSARPHRLHLTPVRVDLPLGGSREELRDLLILDRQGRGSASTIVTERRTRRDVRELDAGYTPMITTEGGSCSSRSARRADDAPCRSPGGSSAPRVAIPRPAPRASGSPSRACAQRPAPSGARPYG